MDRNRQEIRAASHSDPGFGGMLLLSLGFHLLIVYLFVGVLTPRFERELRPVYYVDLITPPVTDPRAGRPEGVPEPVEAPPRPEPPPAPQPAPKPEPKPAPPPKPEAKPEPKLVPPKPPTKAEPKPEPKPAPKVTAADEKALAEKLRRMQAKQEREETKQAIEKLMARDTRQAGSTAGKSSVPVGEPTGQGTEIGISHQTWVGTHLKEHWAYSTGLAPERLDLEAKFSLYFDKAGKLVNYKMEKGSGVEQFDQSVVRAILKLFRDRRLPNPPKEPSRLEVTFNLKDLQG